MATTPHANLTGANLHEPKGAATATAGQVYVATGGGSGTWKTIPQGVGYYRDSKTGASVQTFTTTASVLQNDGAHADTLTDYLPNEIRGSSDLWDTTNDKLLPIALGDAYSITVNFTVAADTGVPTLITATLDTGGGATITDPIYEAHYPHDTPPYNFAFNATVMARSAMVTNGCQIFVESDSGTIDVNDFHITITRVSGGAI